MYRQGDVLLMAASAANLGREIPAGPRGHVIVRGATGHSHIVRGAKMFEGDDGRIVVAVEPFALVHETDAGVETGEHATLTIPAGTYLVIQQSQYRGEVSDVED